jgi:hypothetical protein
MYMYVASPEDNALAKLEWYRMGGEVSDRQWNDILGILKVRAHDIELDYLRRWAAELGLSDLSARVRRRRHPLSGGQPAPSLRHFAEASHTLQACNPRLRYRTTTTT